MTDILVGFGSALWLGIMTSISPCPLATNVAAISFLSKKITHPFLVLLSGVAYTLGRVATYAILGFILVNSILNVPQVAQFLQKYMVKAIGPILIVTGLILLDIIKINFPGLSLSQKHHNKLDEAGLAGAFLLGVVFALAFCPVSAALFFGSLIPLALSHKSGVILPFIYGIGTGLPVLIFAVMLAIGVASLSHWFRRLAALELYMRKITGAIFVLVGLYYSSVYYIVPAFVSR
ncbi:MAG: aromatic aminobenezylarsenical efflux permease ArsG family transporter [Candidatus Omnitrophica bacterium]|nr:aromatic aminobenezylarsenical efflux permease ArsG family transporter [Candidatus Omnitrophota bacterium]